MWGVHDYSAAYIALITGLTVINSKTPSLLFKLRLNRESRELRFWLHLDQLILLENGIWYLEHILTLVSSTTFRPEAKFTHLYGYMIMIWYLSCMVADHTIGVASLALLSRLQCSYVIIIGNSSVSLWQLLHGVYIYVPRVVYRHAWDINI